MNAVRSGLPSTHDPVRRRIMQSNRARDTKPELAVRRLLHADGLRFRVDFAPIPGVRRRADIVFPRSRIAVFVDGCFWHRCPLHGTKPATNSEFWTAKLARNVERDRDTDRTLRERGWDVRRYWEHEDPVKVAKDIAQAHRLWLESVTYMPAKRVSY